MGSFVYVGNLAPSSTEDAIRKAFTAGGTTVKSVVLLKSSTHDRSRGFGFVEVGSEEEITATIAAMNGVELDGRKLTVSQARERAGRPRNDGRGFESYSGLGRSFGGPRRSGSTSGARRKAR
jgi:RNA recognition motif-containing protein